MSKTTIKHTQMQKWMVCKCIGRCRSDIFPAPLVGVKIITHVKIDLLPRQRISSSWHRIISVSYLAHNSRRPRGVQGRPHIRWIETEEMTSIWSTNWHVAGLRRLVPTNRVDAPQLVSELINSTSTSQNWEKLMEFFTPADVVVITSIPLDRYKVTTRFLGFVLWEAWSLLSPFGIWTHHKSLAGSRGYLGQKGYAEGVVYVAGNQSSLQSAGISMETCQVFSLVKRCFPP
jgi:hypothetical protein